MKIDELWRTAKKYLLKQFVLRKNKLVDHWSIATQYKMVMWLSYVAGFGGFQLGTDTGMISGIFSKLKKSENVSDSQLDGIALTASLAAILGAGLCSFLANMLGRKKTILIADSVFLVGYMTMAAPYIFSIFLGRFLIGLGIGMVAVVCPVFVAEFVPEDVRGSLNSLNGLCMTLGMIFAKLIKLGLFKAPMGWRWMLAVASVPAAIQFLLIWQLWESPWWLVCNGQQDEAFSVLKKCYPADKADEKFQEIKGSFEPNASHSDGSSNTKFKKLTFREALLATAIVHLAYLVGIRALSYYGGLRESSDAPLMTRVFSFILGLLCSVFVDRVGRKKVMIISLILMALTFHSLALISYLPRVPDVQDEALFSNSSCYVPPSRRNCLGCLQENCGFCISAENQKFGACARKVYNNQLLCIQNNREWHEKSCPDEWDLTVKILFIIYRGVHSVGLDTVPSIINSEIFPVQHLSVGSGLGYMSGAAFSLLGAQIFIPMAKNQGSGLTYWANAMWCWVVLTAIGFFVPETSKIGLGKAIL